MAWYMNKVVFVVGVYVLDQSYDSPACGQSRVLAHWNTTPLVGTDVPTQTIIVTPSQLVGL